MGDAPSVLVGRSEALREVLRDISRFATLPYPVLIVGETGVGKELAAASLHHQSGRPGAFIPVNCACLPEPLVESQLFGHTRGAFTGAENDRPGLFEAAHRGTLFLDEAENLGAVVQEKLLRVIESGSARRVGETALRNFDVRIVAATNVDPKELIETARLRADLYYRIGVFLIRIPPLRERREDVVPLAGHILKQVAAETGVPSRSLSVAARRALEACPWPGNVRELENVLRRASVTAQGDRIERGDLLVAGNVDAPQAASLKGYARRLIEAEGQRVPLGDLARQLGISRKTLWLWRREWADSASDAHHQDHGGRDHQRAG